jgi:hypothetical protein
MSGVPYVADLVQQTNGTFNFPFVLTAWADLYPLGTQGVFHAEMRDAVDDPVALFEWSTAKGNLTYSQSLANGFISFTANPPAGVPGQIIQLGSSLVTFGTDVPIGDTLPQTLASLLAFLQASIDSQIASCTYSVSASTILNVVFTTAGTLGNAFVLNTAVSGASVSGPTLTGGGGLLTMTANVTDIENFDGVYYYDCRWENGSEMVPLFGGTITFVQGVTRD